MDAHCSLSLGDPVGVARLRLVRGHVQRDEDYLLSESLLEQRFYRFPSEQCIPLLGVTASTKLPDGEQAGEFVRREVLPKDVQGLLHQLLFGFDDGAQIRGWD
jgi:hypothetical protein